MVFKNLFSQPYKPFFSLAFFNGMLFIALFSYFKNSNFSLFLHSYSMIFLVFSNFFYGFSLTTFPKFAQSAPINQKSYSYIFIFNIFATLFFLFGIFFKEALFIALVMMLFSLTFLLKIYLSIYKQSKANRSDLYSIIFSFGIGAISNIFFFIALLPNNQYIHIYLKYAINIGVYLYMLFLSIIIAFKMIPFFSSFAYTKGAKFNIIIFSLLLFYMLSISYYPKIATLFSLLLALFLTSELIKMNFTFNKENIFLTILHLGLTYLPLAFFLDTIIKITQLFNSAFILNFFILHLLMLGFLNTIAIGFISRVSLAHATMPLKSSKWFVSAFILTQIVVILRSIYAFWQEELFFYAAIALFFLLYLLMLSKVGKIYLTR